MTAPTGRVKPIARAVAVWFIIAAMLAVLVVHLLAAAGVEVRLPQV